MELSKLFMLNINSVPCVRPIPFHPTFIVIICLKDLPIENVYKYRTSVMAFFDKYPICWIASINNLLQA
jgi:hypothetical protein